MDFFPSIQGDADSSNITEIESLCMNCHDQGTTRLMLTTIPYFKEIIIASFSCQVCGHTSSDGRFGGAFQNEGSQISLIVKEEKDLNRQVIKSEWGKFSIPEIEFESSINGKGDISTIEGMLDSIIAGLLQEQPLRVVDHPTLAKQIDEFIVKINELKTCRKEFTFTIDDPSGNSFVENIFAPSADPLMKISHYPRTRDQNISLGLHDDTDSLEEADNEEFHQNEEVLNFDGNCSNCGKPCESRMKLTEIPFFKEVVIMATTCEACGFKDVEVKSGCGIEDKGTKITLNITDESDMTRDVLKSDTCSLSIPHMDLHLDSYGKGKFTTIEGLLVDMRDKLTSLNPFSIGDSAGENSRDKMRNVADELNNIINGKTNVKIILDDCTGNTYVQNLYAPDDDPELIVERYVRSYDQNDELGLNDINVDC